MYTGQYDRLGVTIWESNRTVIRAAWKTMPGAIRRNPQFRSIRHDLYRRMLLIHRKARKLAVDFAL